MKLSLSTVVLLFIVGCAGPLALQEPARTLGRGNFEASAGGGVGAGVVLKASYGLLNSLDIGVQFEMLSQSLRLKYAFLNAPEEGLSLAVATGGGKSSLDSWHVYLDVMASYKIAWIEPYLAYRHTYLYLSRSEHPLFTVQSKVLPYGLVFVGTRFLLNQKAFLGAEGAWVVPYENSRSEQPFLWTLSGGYRF